MGFKHDSSTTATRDGHAEKRGGEAPDSYKIIRRGPFAYLVSNLGLFDGQILPMT